MNQPLLTVVPLPEKRIFESNNSTISGLSQSGTYLPNGSYTLSCSSSSNVNQDAHHAFNNNKKYWESNYRGNPSYNALNSSYPDYTQAAYTGRYPSAYRGGGKKGNTFITKIGVDKNINDVKGEWLQIKIPYQVFLKSYSIEVPPSSRSNGFPKEFIVAGSNDGDNWEALHTKTMPSEFKSTKQQFEFVYPKKFSHFRLIITKLQGPLEKVQISNWSLFGNTVLISKQEEHQESFVSLGRCLDCTRSSDNSSIDNYAPYVEGFDNYTYTSELRQKTHLPESDNKLDESEKKSMYNRYAKAVEEKQINPLQKKAAQYEENVKEITTNHQELSNTLNSITNANQTGLLDELKKDPSYKNSMKMRGQDNIEDARLKDIEQMINTNNEIYVLGGIATATLLVFSGMIWMKQ